jgi:hypothetical protein
MNSAELDAAKPAAVNESSSLHGQHSTTSCHAQRRTLTHWFSEACTSCEGALPLLDVHHAMCIFNIYPHLMVMQ